MRARNQESAAAVQSGDQGKRETSGQVRGRLKTEHTVALMWELILMDCHRQRPSVLTNTLMFLTGCQCYEQCTHEPLLFSLLSSFSCSKDMMHMWWRRGQRSELVQTDRHPAAKFLEVNISPVFPSGVRGQDEDSETDSHISSDCVSTHLLCIFFLT